MKKQIDRFAIVQVLSEGGGGSVYLADELLPGGIKRPVALKVLPVASASDRRGQKRYLEEFRLLAALGGHPNVVTVYSMGLSDNVPWIAMEYIPANLGQVVGEQPAAADQVSRMMQQVAAGLGAIHGLQPPLLHNDLSPSNILLDRHGVHKISDFGLAAQASADRTHVVTTVRYAAPELLSRELGELSPATDLYALGHIAYEMALGRRAHRRQFPAVYDPQAPAKDAPPAKWMAWHCSIATVAVPVHELRPEFPQRLGMVIARLMNKQIAERHQSADQLLADLLSTDLPPANSPGATSSAPIPFPPPAPHVHAGLSPTSPPGAAAAEQYYVRLRGRISGPFDLPTLQRQARQGLVSRLHQVSTDRVNWRGAGTIEGLF